MVRTAARPAGSSRSNRLTAAPSRANSSAVALPIPEAAPVIRATLPRRTPGPAGARSLVMTLPARQAAGGLAAVDDEDLSGEIGGVVRGQKGEQPGDLLPRGVPPERDLPVHLVGHGVGALGPLHR